MDYGTLVAWVIRTVYDQCFRGQTTLYKHTSKVYHVPTKFSHEKAFCAVKKNAKWFKAEMVISKWAQGRQSLKEQGLHSSREFSAVSSACLGLFLYFPTPLCFPHNFILLIFPLFYILAVPRGILERLNLCGHSFQTWASTCVTLLDFMLLPKEKLQVLIYKQCSQKKKVLWRLPRVQINMVGKVSVHSLIGRLGRSIRGKTGCQKTSLPRNQFAKH